MSACIPDMPSFLHYHRPWTNFKIIATRRGITFDGSVKPGKVIRSEVKSAYAECSDNGLDRAASFKPAAHVDKFTLSPANKLSLRRG